MKHRAKKLAEETANSKTYKYATRYLNLFCPLCAPNKGCNRKIKNYVKNWKKFRKTRWK